MRRPGHTLVELLVVLPLALLLAALTVTALVAQSRLARAVTGAAARAEAERIAAAVLPAELRWAAAGDLRSETSDSVRLRVFRGFGVPCAVGGVHWYGLRAPDPDKDSLLVVSAGSEQVIGLAGVAADPACGGFRLEPVPPPGTGIVLLFETGTYYLRDRALRFRVGGEGRQPLTEEWFVDAASGLRPLGAEAMELRVALRPAGSSAGPDTRRLRWTLPNRLAGDRP